LQNDLRNVNVLNTSKIKCIGNSFSRRRREKLQKGKQGQNPNDRQQMQKPDEQQAQGETPSRTTDRQRSRLAFE
jgi:hypothetical protein